MVNKRGNHMSFKINQLRILNSNFWNKIDAKSGVYTVINPINKETIYIGQSKNTKRRIKQLIKTAFYGHKTHMGGKDMYSLKNFNNFEIEIDYVNNQKQEKQKRLQDYKEQFGELPFANKKL
ncbi:MAG: GIY-YIG nuclease family protein [Clostridia bacterium]|nr:GIY-YIG nuclease family protein [Clostridia bacterium]